MASKQKTKKKNGKKRRAKRQAGHHEINTAPTPSPPLLNAPVEGSSASTRTRRIRRAFGAFVGLPLLIATLGTIFGDFFNLRTMWSYFISPPAEVARRIEAERRTREEVVQKLKSIAAAAVLRRRPAMFPPTFEVQSPVELRDIATEVILHNVTTRGRVEQVNRRYADPRYLLELRPNVKDFLYFEPLSLPPAVSDTTKWEKAELTLILQFSSSTIVDRHAQEWSFRLNHGGTPMARWDLVGRRGGRTKRQ